MGRKVHPYGFRVGVTKDWQSKWFADQRHYPELVLEDARLRKLIMKTLPDAGVPEAAAREAFRKAHHKLPVDTKVLMREEVYS